MDQFNETNEVQDQTLFVWKAPLRPYKKRSTTLLRFFLAVALLVSAVVFFFGDLVTILPIWALLFLFYILNVLYYVLLLYRVWCGDCGSDVAMGYSVALLLR